VGEGRSSAHQIALMWHHAGQVRRQAACYTSTAPRYLADGVPLGDAANIRVPEVIRSALVSHLPGSDDGQATRRGARAALG
jgi:hypothetical protein